MIVAENITKYYGAEAAVSGLSLKTRAGEVVGLLGLNGAGKTTTLRILSGLLVPTSGTVTIDGVDMAREPEAARSRIGFLPETPPLYPEMSVEGYLRFVARIHGVRGELEQAIDEAVAATDLQDRRSDRIDTLSHGFQRRVGIAHAIVHRPAVILLDEPTSGLDPRQILHMRTLIRGLRERHTVIVSSHILSEIHQLCDRILVMQKGRIVAEGSEAALAQQVSGTTTVRVEVRGDAERFAAAVASLASVTGHKIIDQHDGIVQAHVELTHDEREQLAQALISHGLGLRRLERVQIELESIFLQLTGDKLDA